jgi:hypothetical protein
MLKGFFAGKLLKEVDIDATDVSAECKEAQKSARFPEKNEHEERTQSSAGSQTQRQKSDQRLKETTSSGLFLKYFREQTNP